MDKTKGNNNMLEINVQALVGTNIGKAVNDAKKLAVHLQLMVSFSFNEALVRVAPNSVVSIIVNDYLDVDTRAEQEG